MTELCYGYYRSPIGLIEIGGTERAVRSLNFVQGQRPGYRAGVLVEEAVRQMRAYFEDDLRSFDLPLELAGTEFQRAVWAQLLAIPFGSVVSYQDIALTLGAPKAVRAVGAANGRNPISIIIPCHRVIGVDGKLTGYGGGLWRKEWLLRHEGSLLF